MFQRTSSDMRILTLLFVIGLCSSSMGNQFLQNPYLKFFRYSYPQYYNSISSTNYADHVPVYNSPYVEPYTQQLYETDSIASYVAHPNSLPSFNVLAELPYSIEKSFTVVPMLVVSEDNLNMVSNAHIVTVSKKKPTVVIKTDTNVLQCTPAVKIILQTPIVVYNIKTPILFPSEMTIVHDNIRIPIRVGAVIAPISPEIHLSEDSPVSIEVVYAIPTKPIKVDYVNNEKDTVIDTASQSVSVDNNDQKIPLVQFPIISPVVQENEDADLVNRNPPEGALLDSPVPAVFTNSKESAVLTSLREEAKKKRI